MSLKFFKKKSFRFKLDLHRYLAALRSLIFHFLIRLIDFPRHFNLLKKFTCGRLDSYFQNKFYSRLERLSGRKSPSSAFQCQSNETKQWNFVDCNHRNIEDKNLKLFRWEEKPRATKCIKIAVLRYVVHKLQETENDSENSETFRAFGKDVFNITKRNNNAMVLNFLQNLTWFSKHFPNKNLAIFFINLYFEKIHKVFP